jgi:hypothetical protein
LHASETHSINIKHFKRPGKKNYPAKIWLKRRLSQEHLRRLGKEEPIIREVSMTLKDIIAAGMAAQKNYTH